MNYAFEESSPSVHPEASVSAEATLVGDVRIAQKASVWPGAVLRGDFDSVEVGKNSHVEDNVTVHISSIGSNVMVGHGVVIDSSVVGDRVLIGNNATVNSGVTIGSGSIVAAGAVVPDDREVPPMSFVRGVPATVEPLEDVSIDPDAVFEYYSTDVYTDLVSRYDELFE